MYIIVLPLTQCFLKDFDFANFPNSNFQIKFPNNFVLHNFFT